MQAGRSRALLIGEVIWSLRFGLNSGKGGQTACMTALDILCGPKAAGLSNEFRPRLFRVAGSETAAPSRETLHSIFIPLAFSLAGGMLSVRVCGMWCREVGGSI